MPITLKKGSELELEIETLAFGAKGLARLNGFVIFVERSLPGQRLRVQITKKKGGYAEARPLEILRESQDYVAPRCRHFADCGGCLVQNLGYEAQLAAKQRQVAEVLQHLGGMAQPPVLPIVGSPEQFFYRNKMEFSFARQRWLTRAEIASGVAAAQRDFSLGLHARNCYDKTLMIEECLLLSERSNEVLTFVREAARSHPLPPYTTRDHTGFWRFLVLREGKRTGDFMVNVVTHDVPDGRQAVAELSRALVQQFSFITTIVHNLNRSKAQVAIGEQEFVLHGPGILRDRIGAFEFNISANSFFQTNTLGAEKLYSVAADFAQLTGKEIVYDLYSGAGTISIFVSKQARLVVGFEIVPEAIRDASVNCTINNVTNCHFIEGDLKDELAHVPVLKSRWGQPAVVIADPPRAGMHPRVIQKVFELAPQRIVYVSCNPSTFARDVKEMCSRNYLLEKVQPVDMFPHTAHCEMVGLLMRQG
ncbi:MAG: 23S rRNA (uracil(1939)-C(5))-methyltransferase RlmD [bacterium]